MRSVDSGFAGDGQEFDDASLNLDYRVDNRRIEFQDVTLNGVPGHGMGGVFFDHSLAGYLRIRSGGALSSAGTTFDSYMSMTDGRLGYRTNGNEVFLHDITMTAEALGITLDVVRPGLEINLPRLTGSYDVGAIRYSGNPSNHGRSRDAQSGQLLPSYGSLAGDFDFSTRLGLSGGGSPVNGSGTQLVLNDIYTSDGDGSNRNTLGIQTDLALDIYQTKV